MFVDCDRDTWCMSAQKLESAVKKCVKANELYPRAAIVSDLFGMPFECAEISRVCAEYGLLLIEDASSAMGSVCKGRKAGTLGDASVISFPSLVSSNIQGDSAVVLTDDVQLAKNIKLTVNGGEKVFGASTGAKETVRRGETSVMDDLTASLLHMNISETDKSAEKRRRNAELLKKAAEGTSVKFQIEKEGVQGAYPVFTLCAEDKESAERMVQAFRESGIESRAVYSKPLCRHAAFKELGCQISDVPVGSELSVCTFLLPCHEKLTDKEVEYIGEKIKTICV